MRTIFLFLAMLLSAAAQPLPVTIDEAPSTTPAGGSFAPVMDGSGRRVAFVSAAKNLGATASGQHLEVYVKDFFTGLIRPLSVPQSAQAPLGNSQFPSLSAAGDVVFSSEADALAVGDTNRVSDIYAHDQGFPARIWLTRDSSGPLTGPIPGSSRPVIARDAFVIAFESSATNLVANDSNRLTDVFVFRAPEGFRVISVGAQPRQPGSTQEKSYAPSISADGSRVAFLSTALLPEGSNAFGAVFVRDLDSNVTHWASFNAMPGPSSGDYGYHDRPTLSANGRAVVWKSSFEFGGVPTVIHRDLESGVVTRIVSSSRFGTLPAVSADGLQVAYDYANQIFLWNATTRSNTLVSVNNSGVAANGVCMRPVMTPDARFIAFLSTATNLVTNVIGNTNFQLYVRDLQERTTRLASFNTNRRASLNGVAQTVPSISDDGAVVVFDYNGPDLVARDHNDASDVFVCNLFADEVVLVSHRNVNMASSITTGTGAPELNSISADGRRVTFTAFDDPRIVGDTNRVRDTFVRDLNSGALVNLSLDLPRFGRGRQPLISASGNAVLFLVTTNSPGTFDDIGHRLGFYHKDLMTGTLTLVDPELVPIASFGTPDLTHLMQAISADGNLVVYEKQNRQLYLRDIAAGTNQLISARHSGGGTALRGSGNALLSPDSRYVVFNNSGGDLTPPPPGGFSTYSNLYARDLSLGQTFLLSADTNGFDLRGHSVATTFSASGRYLVFSGAYEHLGGRPTRTYLYDFDTRRTTAICTNCTEPYLSADGRYVAYLRPRASSQIRDVYVQELSSGQTWLISENASATGGANNHAFAPALSADGRYVIFTSKASDLVANDANNVRDVFVRDRLRGVTLSISASGNGLSLNPILAADGRTLVFQSFANNLVDRDYNRRLDIFTTRLGAGDSDDDGMDDNWEQTYFNGLHRDGTGDYDGDGQTDLGEYLAGTDPTNEESVFEVLVISSSGFSKYLLWSAVPGRTYVVQRKAALSDAAWATISPSITADSTTASWSTVSGSAQGFYRVRVLSKVP